MNEEKPKFELMANTGNLFKNFKKKNDKQPDYTGKLNVGGYEWLISAWVKPTKSGGAFLALSITDPEELEAKKKNYRKDLD